MIFWCRTEWQHFPWLGGIRDRASKSGSLARKYLCYTRERVVAVVKHANLCSFLKCSTQKFLANWIRFLNRNRVGETIPFSIHWEKKINLKVILSFQLYFGHLLYYTEVNIFPNHKDKTKTFLTVSKENERIWLIFWVFWSGYQLF